MTGSRLSRAYFRLRSSLWFIPTVLVLAGVGVALGLVSVDEGFSPDLVDGWPRLFGVSAEGSRSMLTAIATSMATIAGVVFSITIVVISLAASQYSPNVLRNFMRDRTNQAVLGTFVGIFAYCLIVLRTIRTGAESFVPSLAVSFGLVLALVGIAVLVFFIHHIVVLIQASQIVQRIAHDTTVALDRAYPESLERERRGGSRVERELECGPWTTLNAPRSGYVTHVEWNSLMELARRGDTVVRMERGIGDFAIEGCPLVSVCAEKISRSDRGRLCEAFGIGPQRTVDQDPAFGIRQIVDVALKALSPGINDVTTAVMAVDYLSALLLRVCRRSVGERYRYDGDDVRIFAHGATFQDLVDLAFRQIRQNAGIQTTIFAKLLEAIAALAERTESRDRRQALLRQAQLVRQSVEQQTPLEADRGPLMARARRLERQLEGDGRRPVEGLFGPVASGGAAAEASRPRANGRGA